MMQSGRVETDRGRLGCRRLRRLAPETQQLLAFYVRQIGLCGDRSLMRRGLTKDDRQVVIGRIADLREMCRRRKVTLRGALGDLQYFQMSAKDEARSYTERRDFLRGLRLIQRWDTTPAVDQLARLV